MYREQLLLGLREKCVLRALERKPFKLKSGKESDYYINIRIASLSPAFLFMISSCISDVCLKNQFFPNNILVAGVALGGCPLATGLSMYLYSKGFDVSAIYVRPEVKDHGAKSLVEGEFKPGDKVLLLEDVVTTGASTIRALSLLQGEGLPVVGVISVLDRQEGGNERIKGHCPFFESIFTIEELLKDMNGKLP